MEWFKQLFNTNLMDEQELGQIEYILTHPAYERYFRPYMQHMHDSMIVQWKLPQHARSHAASDEELRQGARFIEGLMRYFDEIIKHAQVERVLRSQDLVPSDPHQYARETGLVGSPPAHVETLPPEQDF